MARIGRLGNRPTVLGSVIITFFCFLYIILLLNKYWQFEFFSADNVYFDQALWQVAHGQSPIVNHDLLGRINILGDHFHPTIFILSIVYLFTSRQEAILIAMVAVYGLGAFMGMKVGFSLLKSRVAVYSLLAAYFLYLGVQNGLLYGFHELALMPLFFFLTLYFFLKGRTISYWFALLLLFLTKESLIAVGIGIGLFIVMELPKERKLGIATIVFSIVYYVIITNIVVPHFSTRSLYREINYPTSLSETIKRLTDSPKKWETFIVSTATFAFLPLLNPATLPMVAQDFVTRYVFSLQSNIQYELNYHYNLALAPILFFSSVWSLRRIERSRFRELMPPIILLILGGSLFFHRFYTIKGPLLLVTNPEFYRVTQKNKFLWELIDHVPDDGKIMTQNHLVYPLSHKSVYLMRTSCDLLAVLDPKYIVFDLRSGQNQNNFFPLTEARTKKMKDFLLESSGYKVYFYKNDMYILERTGLVNYAIPQNCQKI